MQTEEFYSLLIPLELVLKKISEKGLKISSEDMEDIKDTSFTDASGLNIHLEKAGFPEADAVIYFSDDDDSGRTKPNDLPDGQYVEYCLGEVDDHVQPSAKIAAFCKSCGVDKPKRYTVLC